MSASNLDTVRGSVLTRMERADRLVRLAIYGATAVELALFAVAIYLVDWDNRLEKLLFVFSVLSYTIIALGLLALGGHVTRSVGRVLAAMDPGGAR
ncbi:MAG TPA: hypothetical protein VGB15_08430 [Longimicrobium sp.]|jgi:small-conductance mechanosensitive channel